MRNQLSTCQQYEYLKNLKTENLEMLFSVRILMNTLDKLSLCFGMHENSVNLAKNCL